MTNLKNADNINLTDASKAGNQANSRPTLRHIGIVTGGVLWLPDGEEIVPLAFFVLTQYRRVTDRQTDGQVAIAITRASIASRG